MLGMNDETPVTKRFTAELSLKNAFYFAVLILIESMSPN